MARAPPQLTAPLPSAPAPAPGRLSLSAGSVSATAEGSPPLYSCSCGLGGDGLLRCTRNTVKPALKWQSYTQEEATAEQNDHQARQQWWRHAI